MTPNRCREPFQWFRAQGGNGAPWDDVICAAETTVCTPVPVVRVEARRLGSITIHLIRALTLGFRNLDRLGWSLG